jgi:hypothetical protein
MSAQHFAFALGEQCKTLTRAAGLACCRSRDRTCWRTAFCSVFQQHFVVDRLLEELGGTRS